ncbi:hypothetical protein Q5H92_16385 [Hymenobacter sp. M29]|uniref:Uncharacterized protein n=1 Tax=Hymenobacter mellowenesis TaxID=3063995 RepID=A0ABT9ADN9_9BACT|nr:hypothetical protein [Hymenobacter sp. M29]MDO7847945.1 hypothetical protein [Hymenobacter sp. M29]
MNTATYPRMQPWPAWPRLAGLVLALGLLDCFGAWGLLYVNSLVVSYAYGHGISETIELSVWVVVIGWVVGITLHLIALNRAARQQQKSVVAILITSSLWLTWLCAIVGAFSAYATLIGDLLHAAFGR